MNTSLNKALLTVHARARLSRALLTPIGSLGTGLSTGLKPMFTSVTEMTECLIWPLVNKGNRPESIYKSRLNANAN